jgi:hypothetical protein
MISSRTCSKILFSSNVIFSPDPRHLQRSILQKTRHLSKSLIWLTEQFRNHARGQFDGDLWLIRRTLSRVSAEILVSNQSRWHTFPRVSPEILACHQSLDRFSVEILTACRFLAKNYTWNPNKNLKLEKAYLGSCIHRDSAIKFIPLVLPTQENRMKQHCLFLRQERQTRMAVLKLMAVDQQCTQEKSCTQT